MQSNSPALSRETTAPSLLRSCPLNSGVCTTTLGTLCQHLAALNVLFPYNQSKCALFYSETISPCPITHNLLKSLFSSFSQPLQILNAAITFPQSPPFFQAAQPVFHPTGHFYGPLLDTLQQVHITPAQSTPQVDAVLWVRPHSTKQRGRITLSPCWPCL